MVAERPYGRASLAAKVRMNDFAEQLLSRLCNKGTGMARKKYEAPTLRKAGKLSSATAVSGFVPSHTRQFVALPRRPFRAPARKGSDYQEVGRTGGRLT
jgi:hypothetical protein